MAIARFEQKRLFLVLGADGTVWTTEVDQFGEHQAVYADRRIGRGDRDRPGSHVRADSSSSTRCDGMAPSGHGDATMRVPASIPGLTGITGISSGYAIEGFCVGGGGKLWRIQPNTRTAARVHGFGDNCGGIPRVAVSASVIGQGRILSVPAGIDCPGALCRFFFPRDSRVALHSAPARGWKLGRWGGDPGCGNQSLNDEIATPVLAGDLNCTATFVEGGERRLAVQLDGGGSVLRTPEGIDCGPDLQRALRVRCFSAPRGDACARLSIRPIRR